MMLVDRALGVSKRVKISAQFLVRLIRTLAEVNRKNDRR